MIDICNPSKAQAIAAAGASVNAAAYDGRTPLHLAAAGGHLSLVRHIIAGGGQPHARDRWGRTPLADAVAEGHSDVEEALRLAGSARPETRAAPKRPALLFLRRGNSLFDFAV